MRPLHVTQQQHLSLSLLCSPYEPKQRKKWSLHHGRERSVEHCEQRPAPARRCPLTDNRLMHTPARLQKRRSRSTGSKPRTSTTTQHPTMLVQQETQVIRRYVAPSLMFMHLMLIHRQGLAYTEATRRPTREASQYHPNPRCSRAR